MEGHPTCSAAGSPVRRGVNDPVREPPWWGIRPIGSTADSSECLGVRVAFWCTVWNMNPAQRGDTDVLVHVTTGSLSLDAIDVALRSATVATLPSQSSLRSYVRDLALGRG